MITIKPTEEDWAYARSLRDYNNPNFPRDWEGAWENKLIGELGEVCVRRILGLPKKPLNKDTDGGKDFVINGVKIDLKTQRGRHTLEEMTYGFNIQASTLEYGGADVILFALFNTVSEDIRIAGGIHKRDIKKVGIHYPQGSINPSTGKPFPKELYEVPRAKLITPEVFQVKYETL